MAQVSWQLKNGVKIDIFTGTRLLLSHVSTDRSKAPPPHTHTLHNLGKSDVLRAKQEVRASR